MKSVDIGTHIQYLIDEYKNKIKTLKEQRKTAKGSSRPYLTTEISVYDKVVSDLSDMLALSKIKAKVAEAENDN